MPQSGYRARFAALSIVGGILRRSSKSSPAGFLHTLLGSVVTGLASFNQLADSLKDFAARPMARQPLHENIDAIRALSGIVRDGQESIHMTNDALGIKRNFIGKKERANFGQTKQNERRNHLNP